jgi:hypothetical protein
MNSDIEKEFTGAALIDLVCGIEAAIGVRKAGMTPLGMAVTHLCETAIRDDKSNQAPPIGEAADQSVMMQMLKTRK